MNTEVISTSFSAQASPSTPGFRWRARDLLALLLLAIVFFILERTTFNDPYYWDSSYPADVANRMFHDHLNPVMKNFSDPGHPVLIEELYAAGWLAMGRTPAWWPHLVAFALSFLVLLYSYRIGSCLGSSLAGLVAAFLILLDPLFLASAGTIYPALPSVGFAAATIYYLLIDEPGKFALAGSLTALTYIPTGIFLGCLLAIAIVLRFRRGPRILLWYLVPGFTLAAWLIFHRLAYGYFVSDPGYWTAGQRSLSLSADHLRYNVIEVFLRSWRLPFTILAFTGGVLLVALMLLGRKAAEGWAAGWYQRLGGNRAAILFLVLVVGAVAYLPIITATTGLILLGRYQLVLMVPLFLLAVRFLQASRITWLWLLLCIAMGWNLHAHWYSRKEPWRGIDETLLYRRLIRLEQLASNYLSTQYASATILAALPHSAELTVPWLDYVQHPLKVEQVRDVSPDTPVDLIYYSTVTSNEDKQRLFRAVDRQSARPIQDFRNGDVRIVILKTGENRDLPENRYAAVLISSPLDVGRRDLFEVTVAFQNLGRNVWSTPPTPWVGLGAVNAAYQWERDGKILPDDGRRTRFSQNYFWGDTAVMKMLVRAPQQPGRYTLILDLVGPQNNWFGQLGNSPVRTDIVVH